jgi:hypothetical protein
VFCVRHSDAKCPALPRGVEIAKQLKEQSGPKLKDFRALLEKGVPQPIEDLKMEVGYFSSVLVSSCCTSVGAIGPCIVQLVHAR